MTSWSAVSERAEHPDPPVCRHYWVIQPASGPLSPGVCQVCGETREFKNYLGDHVWDDYNLALRSGPDSLRMVARAADGLGTAGDDDEG